VALINLALVVETRRVQRSAIKEVAAALQRQISRDFAPVWNVDATVDPFISLDDVPPGYWPIIVRDDLPGVDIIGIHLDDKGQPFALVQYSNTWSLVASHEALEMLADPWGNRLVPGGSPRPGQGLVEILVEVCDPPSDVAHAYTVNGHLVSDFVTPDYYEPVAVPGARYSFTSAVTRPRQIARGGYLSWREPTTDEWWWWEWVTSAEPRFRRLGRLADPTKPLREQVDMFGLTTQLYTGAPPDHPVVRAAEQRLASTRAAAQADALRLRRRITRLTGGPPPSSGEPPGEPPRRDGPEPPVNGGGDTGKAGTKGGAKKAATRKAATKKGGAKKRGA
jgi:hypothetical protein